MLSVFLSASIPLPHRHPKYLETADVVAIRDSIRAVVSVVVPGGQIVFGGHPATTPLIRLLVRGMTPNVRNVILYQSLFFKTRFPPKCPNSRKFVSLMPWMVILTRVWPKCAGP